jgi:hypothetical protein
MGNGASLNPTVLNIDSGYSTKLEALEAGKTEEEISSFMLTPQFEEECVKCAKGHEMAPVNQQAGPYAGMTYACDLCGKDPFSVCKDQRTLVRWNCLECCSDICFTCRPTKEAPTCSCPEPTNMIFSDYQEGGYANGYSCDFCSQLNPSGIMTRWFCKNCSGDICFQCRPPLGVNGKNVKRKPTTEEDIISLMLFLPPPAGVTTADHHFVVDFIATSAILDPQNAAPTFAKFVNFARRHNFIRQDRQTNPSDICHSAAVTIKPWIIAALKEFAQDKEKDCFVHVIKFLLGDLMFGQCGLGALPISLEANISEEVLAGDSYDPTFLPALHVVCDQRLDSIAKNGEEMCAENNFCELLRDVGSEKLQNTHSVRLDTVVGDNSLWLEMEQNLVLDDMTEQGNPKSYGFTLGIHILNFVANSYFADIAGPLVISGGGKWKMAPPKNEDRMMGKLAGDHKDEADPKACANIDGVRGCGTFPTPDTLKACFETLSAHPCITFLRVKNAFAQEKGNYGYRAILVNMKYEAMSETPMSWSDVWNSEKAKESRARFMEMYLKKYGVYLKHCVEDVFQRLEKNERFLSLPFSWIGEVQFLTDHYLAMRKESHLWYKIKRQTDLYNLMNDFAQYRLPRKT